MLQFKVTIRSEEEKDVDVIYNVISEAFGKENESKLYKLLRCNENFNKELSIVAVVDENTQQERVVGHILLLPIKLKRKDENLKEEEIIILSLAPLSVIPSFQKKGIGSQLVLKSIKKAKELNYPAIVVLGHKEYYSKFGFQSAIPHNLIPSFSLSDNGESIKEHYFIMELKENSILSTANKNGGTIEYPKEFDSV
ncbi:hypothetical protein ABK040_002312 [Willaertia magna]